MMDRSQMVLALVLKELGGTALIRKETFMDMPDNYEILTQRNIEGNLILELVEDEESVSAIRANRAADEERKAALGKLIVPS
jgi:hypothetical protein